MTAAEAAAYRKWWLTISPLSALADPTRRAIFEDVRRRSAGVTALAAGRPISRPAASHHLKVLLDAGLVEGKAKGAARVYRVRPEGLAPLRDRLDSSGTTPWRLSPPKQPDGRTEMEPIRKTIEVPCTPAAAFRIFTAEIDRWWPKDSHSLSACEGKVALEVTMELREGGAVSETGYNGDTHRWGTIQVWSPPERVAFTWHVGTAPENATSVDVTFHEEGKGTRVELVHPGWENAADPSSRDSYDAGWSTVFEEKYGGACRVAA